EHGSARCPQQWFRVGSGAGDRTGWRTEPTGANRNTAGKLLKPRDESCESPERSSDNRHARFSGPGNRNRCRYSDSHGGCAHDHGWKHHRGRQQDQQEIGDRLRSRQEVPPLRIHLGPIEGYLWHWPTRPANWHWPGTGAGPGTGPGSGSAGGAFPAEPGKPAAESTSTTPVESAAATGFRIPKEW